MSILTKTLIVLLALSSFFLCATVVTYVANADNHKELAKKLRTERDAEREMAKNAKKQLQERKDKYQQQETDLSNEIASLKVQIDKLKGDLVTAQRQKAALDEKVNSWVSITEGFYTTNDKQGQLLKNTLAALNKVQADQVKERKVLNETSATLMQKMAIIETLGAQVKRLVEQKTELENRLNKLWQPMGKQAAVAEPVTPEKTTAKPARPYTKDIGLQGLISDINLKNSMAELSIGSADGVKEGMVFYTSRGDEFI